MAYRICFLALSAYPTLAGTPEARVGGAEVQQTLIARYIARRGFEVSFVTRDHDQPEAELIGGITIHKAFRLEDGLPYLRFAHPRWTGIWNALRRADADIYYQRCASMETGLLAMFCQRHGKRFVFASGSETDFDLEQVIIPTWRDRWLYCYGLHRSNAIVVQTETQRTMLMENFKRNAYVIMNCWAEVPKEIKLSLTPGYVLWVSTLRRWKRPELFLGLAESLPAVQFAMVGGPASGEEILYDQIAQRARGISNLSFVGFVPFHDVGHNFDGASVVVNTSEPKEGFPNTFLQAWCRGIPVVSFFDPDGLIRRQHLGFAVNSLEEMLAGLTKLLSDTKLYSEIKRNIIAYFDANHRIEVIGRSYETLFNGLTR